MSERESGTPTAGPRTVAPAATVPLPAGAQLALAREAAGLTADAVALQLKLAPRQVKALEEGDYEKLPGRTFVRGFIRNYARLLHLDPDAVVAALPGVSTPSLDSPALHPTAPTMGELPAAERGKPGWTRWAIPLILIAVISGAAVYEYLRQHNDMIRAPAAPAAPSTGASQPAPAVTTPPAANQAAGMSLANPLATNDAATGQGAGAVPGAPAAMAPEIAAEPAGSTTLVLTFRGPAWTDVKDRTGSLLSQMNPAGQTQTLKGTPPFDLVIGNATAVALTYRGVAVDLAPYIQKGVARLSLE